MAFPDHGPACWVASECRRCKQCCPGRWMRNVRGMQGSPAALTSLTSIVGPLLFTAIYAASITTWNGWAWIAGAALYFLLCRRRCVAGFGAAQGNEPIADRGNDRPMPCGSRRLPASYTRPRSAVETLAQPDTPDHEQDADDLKRTQRLDPRTTILATRRSPG